MKSSISTKQFIFVICSFTVLMIAAGYLYLNRVESTNGKQDVNGQEGVMLYNISGINILCPADFHIAEHPNLNSKCDESISLKLRNISYPLDDPGDKYLNRHFCRRERRLPIPFEHTALLLMDVWNMDNQRLKEDENIESVIRTKIVPVLNAARNSGLMIIHLPHRLLNPDGSPTESNSYKPVRQYGEKTIPEEIENYYKNKMVWPPLSFSYRSGPFREFVNSYYPAFLPYGGSNGIHQSVRPDKPGNEIIFQNTGRYALHYYLTQRGFLHLIYVGGSLDACLWGRSTSVKNMALLRYNTILIRDAIFSRGFYDENGRVNRVGPDIINFFEMNYGFTTTSSEFIQAVNQYAGRRDN